MRVSEREKETVRISGRRERESLSGSGRRENERVRVRVSERERVPRRHGTSEEQARLDPTGVPPL